MVCVMHVTAGDVCDILECGMVCVVVCESCVVCGAWCVWTCVWRGMGCVLCGVDGGAHAVYCVCYDVCHMIGCVYCHV